MKADTHAQANEAARRADNQLRELEAGKHAKAVPDTSDIFARNAEQARREGWSRTRGPRSSDE